MKKMLLIAAIGSLAIGGGAFAARHSDDAPVKAVGEPVDCVHTRLIQSTNIIDDKTIDFKMGGGKVLRNNLPYSCPTLKSEDRFSYKTTNGQLCSVDTIRVLQDFGGHLSEGAGCGLGKFQQVVPADAS